MAELLASSERASAQACPESSLCPPWLLRKGERGTPEACRKEPEMRQQVRGSDRSGARGWRRLWIGLKWGGEELGSYHCPPHSTQEEHTGSRCLGPQKNVEGTLHGRSAALPLLGQWCCRQDPHQGHWHPGQSEPSTVRFLLLRRRKREAQGRRQDTHTQGTTENGRQKKIPWDQLPPPAPTPDPKSDTSNQGKG